MSEVKFHRVVSGDNHPDDEYPTYVKIDAINPDEFAIQFGYVGYRPILSNEIDIKSFADKRAAEDWFDRFVQMLEEK